MQRNHDGQRFFPLIILTLGIACSVFVWNAQRRNIQENLQMRFSQEVDDACVLFESRIQAQTSTLLAARGLFLASVKVDQEEFRRYVDALDLQNRYPGMMGMFYADCAAFDAGRAPVTLVASEALRPLAGFDLAVERDWSDAIESARLSGSVAGTPPLVLSLLGRDMRCAALLAPVFQGPNTGNSPRSLAGVIVLLLELRQFESGTFSAKYGSRIALEIYDFGIRRPTDGRSFEAELRPVVRLKRDKLDTSNAPFRTERIVSFGSRSWLVRASAHELPAGSSPLTPAAFFLVGGGLISVLLFAIASILSRSEARAIELAGHAQKDLEVSEQNLRHTRELADRLDRSNHFLEITTTAARVGLWETNVLERRVYYSRSWTEIFGYGPGALTGSFEESYSLTHPDDRRAMVNQWRPFLNGERPEVNVEFRLQLGTGGFAWVELKGRPVDRDEQGKPIRIAGVTIDITERKRMEDERMRASKLESIGLLAGGIAHDLNNILTAITGNLQLARQQDGNHEIARLLLAADKACARAATLSSQLLTFAKGGEPVKTRVNTASVLRETVPFCVHGANCAVEMQIAPDLWDVEADKGQLVQVIDNLVINAVQAMPGGGTVRVAAVNINHRTKTPKSELLPGRYVRITVADEGIGIRAEDLGRIFDPYFTTKERGSGLGLSTVYSIIRRHAGAISVQSELGKGTEFQVLFPVCEKEEAIQPNESLPVQLSGVRVLYLDDEPDLRELIEAALAGYGCEVCAVDEGMLAVTRYREALENGIPFDAAVLDLTLPAGLQGKDVAARILSLHSSAALVAVSGYSDDPVMADCRRFGFRAALPKPHSMERLAQTLTAMLREPQGAEGSIRKRGTA